MIYNIGDRVTRLFEGDICIVIATKNEPHKVKDTQKELTGEIIEVPDGADYIVVSEEQLKSQNKFSPYYTVTVDELKVMNQSGVD